MQRDDDDDAELVRSKWVCWNGKVSQQRNNCKKYYLRFKLPLQQNFSSPTSALMAVGAAFRRRGWLTKARERWDSTLPFRFFMILPDSCCCRRQTAFCLQHLNLYLVLFICGYGSSSSQQQFPDAMRNSCSNEIGTIVGTYCARLTTQAWSECGCSERDELGCAVYVLISLPLPQSSLTVVMSCISPACTDFRQRMFGWF